MKKILNRLLRYFFQGLLITLPFVLTVYVIYSGIQFVDGILPLEIPGLGMSIIIVSITVLGFIGSTIIAQPILHILDDVLERTPGIKIIYSSLKDLMKALVGKEKKFNKPVLVRLSKDVEEYRIGFITSDDLTDLGMGSHLVSVYFPHSYAFSGYLRILPKENITPIHASSADIMKFIVSGGVAELDHHKQQS